MRRTPNPNAACNIEKAKRQAELNLYGAQLDKLIKRLKPGEGIELGRVSEQRKINYWKKYVGNKEQYTNHLKYELSFILKGLRKFQNLGMQIKKY